MSAVGDYLTRIESMAGDTDGYIVARDVGIDAAVRLMQEGGFDRALDIFLRLDLATFFALGNDAVSYATWVTRQLADSTREVAPVSRDAAPSTQISTAFNNVFDPRASEE
jgi:hypothetical protein